MQPFKVLLIRGNKIGLINEALYNPDGFTVAFRLIDKQIVLIEIAREAATLIMIWAVAYVTGKNRLHRFAHFLLCFAVLDIFYYVWLKVFIDWPA